MIMYVEDGHTKNSTVYSIPPAEIIRYDISEEKMLNHVDYKNAAIYRSSCDRGHIINQSEN